MTGFRNRGPWKWTDSADPADRENFVNRRTGEFDMSPGCTRYVQLYSVASGCAVLTCREVDGDHPEICPDAEARALIRVAPDMLDVLRETLKHLENRVRGLDGTDRRLTRELMTKIEAVISAATTFTPDP
jgi:hypothetical protein